MPCRRGDNRQKQTNPIYFSYSLTFCLCQFKVQKYGGNNYRRKYLDHLDIWSVFWTIYFVCLSTIFGLIIRSIFWSMWEIGNAAHLLYLTSLSIRLFGPSVYLVHLTFSSILHFGLPDNLVHLSIWSIWLFGPSDYLVYLTFSSILHFGLPDNLVYLSIWSIWLFGPSDTLVHLKLWSIWNFGLSNNLV